MSFQWQFVAVILYTEIAVSLLLCLPVRLSLHKTLELYHFYSLSLICYLVYLVKMVERFFQIYPG